MKKKKTLLFTAVMSVGVIATTFTLKNSLKNASGDTIYGVVFNSSSYVDDSIHYDEETWYYEFDMQSYTKTVGGSQYLVDDACVYIWSSDEESTILSGEGYSFGGSHLFRYHKDKQSERDYVGLYIYVDLQIADIGLITESDVEVTGTYFESNYSCSINEYEADDTHEKNYYQVYIYLDNCTTWDEQYTDLVIDTISISYYCGY